MFTARIPIFAGRGRAQALEAWRDAASVVSTRWRLFLDAASETRTRSFASYLAALDAEEAAAAELAELDELASSFAA
jgi:hypothetical protein